MDEPAMINAFPFSALVGQEQLKLCLLLTAVDMRLSCLIRGDKGSGKSTAARGLAALLPAAPPFVNVPIGVTEDRLLGGLNLDAAFQGRASLKPGLVHEASGGVLYIDEVNLLSGHLTDALLDVCATGRYVLERDGFSQTYNADFVLLGSMNVEEGNLRPQLTDRFALAVDVHASIDAAERVAVLRVRQLFDEAPAAFCATAAPELARLRDAVAAARERVASVDVPDALMTLIAERITAVGVRSLRADLAALRACRALAALEGRDAVTEDDIERVLPLVLLHRAPKGGTNDTPPPPSPPQQREKNDPEEPAPPSQGVRIFAPDSRTAPSLHPSITHTSSPGRATAAGSHDAGADAHPSGEVASTSIDAFASLLKSVKNTAAARLHPEYIVNRKLRPSSGVRYLFVVDCSGSHAARQRMSVVKGVALALIDASVRGDDEVGVIAFRGAAADVLVEPCRDAETVKRQLELVPTGGRTPLAHALECARRYVTPNTCLVLLTDGRANVSLNGGDAWRDALDAATRIECAALVLDTSESGAPRLAELAAALSAGCVRLDELDGNRLAEAFQRKPD